MALGDKHMVWSAVHFQTNKAFCQKSILYSIDTACMAEKTLPSLGIHYEKTVSFELCSAGNRSQDHIPVTKEAQVHLSITFYTYINFIKYLKVQIKWSKIAQVLFHLKP